MPKVILLAGAPEATSWKEEDLTEDTLLPAFARICNATTGDFDGFLSTSDVVDATPTLPPWRKVPLREEYLHTGWSQIHHDEQLLVMQDDGVPSETEDDDIELSFLTGTFDSTAPVGHSRGPETTELSQHLERSLAVHEVAEKPPRFLPASQVSVNSVGVPIVSKSRTPWDWYRSRGSWWAPEPPVPHMPELSNLKALPSPSTITLLEPQTVTVDLVVGVISVSPPRTVTIRRSGRQIDLLELLVGDETKAGFAITIWLDHREQERESIIALRPGQSVGVRLLALRCFRGVVHGQTLGRLPPSDGRIGPRVTEIFRLDNRPVDDYRYFNLSVAQRERIEAVLEWTRKFVKPRELQPSGKRKRVSNGSAADELPEDDTQR